MARVIDRKIAVDPQGQDVLSLRYLHLRSGSDRGHLCRLMARHLTLAGQLFNAVLCQPHELAFRTISQISLISGFSADRQRALPHSKI